MIPVMSARLVPWLLRIAVVLAAVVAAPGSYG
jgi:hypothetical protein